MPQPAEHVITISSEQREVLLDWLENPNGTLRMTGRLAVEAVEGGGVMIRTEPWKPAGT
jgi:hypothetical protein